MEDGGTFVGVVECGGDEGWRGLVDVDVCGEVSFNVETAPGIQGAEILISVPVVVLHEVDEIMRSDEETFWP